MRSLHSAQVFDFRLPIEKRFIGNWRANLQILRWRSGRHTILCNGKWQALDDGRFSRQYELSRSFQLEAQLRRFARRKSQIADRK